MSVAFDTASSDGFAFNSTEAASNRVELVVRVNGTQTPGPTASPTGTPGPPYFDANAVAQAHRNTDRDVDSHSHARTHAYLRRLCPAGRLSPSGSPAISARIATLPLSSTPHTPLA
jgi:hypothetical protein